MARELKPDDRLRRVGGTVVVESVAADQNQPVYNLDVAEIAIFSSEQVGCWSTITASCSQFSSRLIASPSWLLPFRAPMENH